MTKGKITKKLVALATTIMMLAAMIIPVAAAPGNPEGTITVHKLAGNVPGVINNTTGEELTTLPTGYTPLAGAVFTLYTVSATDIAAVNAAITADNKVVKHEIDTSGATPVVEFELYDSVTLATTTLTAAATVVYGTETTAAVTGQAVFGPNIPDGYYVLVETTTPTGYDGAEPSLIRLPLTYGATATNPGTFNYDVHVYPKNVSNTDLAVKNITAEQAPVGVAANNIVPFELKAKFKNNAAAPNTVNSVADLRDGTGTILDPYVYGTAQITEKFSTYFELDGTISVYWLNAAGDIDTGAGALTNVTDYTIATTAATLTEGAIYEVTLTNDAIDTAIAANKVGFGLVLNGKYIGAPTGTTGNPTTLKNTMESLMNPASGDGGGEEEGETNVPSISVKINKTDQETGLALGGVTFAIAKVAVPSINYHPSVTYSGADLATLAAEYVVDPVTNLPITAQTNASGTAAFSHLEGYVELGQTISDGSTAGAEFFLKEIETAPGYQLKVNTIQVVFDTKAGYIVKAGSDPVVATWFNATNEWTAVAQVTEGADISNAPLGTEDEDEPGFSLPLTGGAGTLLFTAVGILVMLGAVVVYLHGKKRNI